MMKIWSKGLLLALVAFFSVSCNKSGDSDLIYEVTAESTYRIVALMGSTHDQYVTEHYPKADILRMDTEPDMFMALDVGKADLAMLDYSSYMLSQGTKEKYVILEHAFSEDFGIGFGLNNTELRDRFNVFLAEIRENGTYDEIYDRWFNNYENARMPEWESKPSGAPLKVGVTGTSEGFAFVRDGRASGFDVDIMEHFGQWIGRPVEFSYINFGGLISSLSSGTVDAICSGITITEERKKMVAFSDMYYLSSSISILRKDRFGSTETASDTYNNMDDVSDKRIGVLMSSVQDQYITDNYPNAQVMRIDLLPDLVYALKSNQCDAIVLPSPEIKEVLAKNPELDVLEQNIYSVHIGIGFQDANLRDRFNAYLAEIKQNGIYEEINNRWITGESEGIMPELDVPLNGTPLIVGTTAQSPPFSFIKDGKNNGFDMELVTRFAASLGRPVTFSNMTFGALIPAIQTGHIDIFANSAMLTEERMKAIPFSDPYYEVESTVLALKKNLAQHSNTTRDGSDLSASNIGVMTGTIAEKYIAEHHPEAGLLIFDDIMDAIAALKAGKLDYVMTSYTTALRSANKNKDLRVLPDEYMNDPAAIAIRLDNQELADQINPIIRQFKESGLLDEIINRWIKKDDTPYESVDIPKATGGEPLRVAISANREPMCFIADNQITGLDCELIERIAYQLGRPVEYSDMKFSALIASLESGRTDLIISNMGVTEERKKRVLFSEDYFVNPQVLLTLESKEIIAQLQSVGWFERLKDSFYSNLVQEKRYQLIIDGLKETIIITFFAALLGTLFGGIICFLRMSRNIVLNSFAKAYISVMRGTPLLVLLMIFFYVVFAKSGLSASVVAIFTFALNMGAYSSEMFRTSIEGVDRGQREAGIALGFSKVQTFIYIILPQAIKSVLPVYKGEVISLLKMTSIVGYIAVVDLTKASDIIRSRTFDAFFPLIIVAIIYFLLAWLLGLALDLLNKKISSTR